MTNHLNQNLEAFYKRFPERKAFIEKGLQEMSSYEGRIETSGTGVHKLYEGSAVVDSYDPTFLEPLRKKEVAGRLLLLEGFGIGASLINAQKTSPIKNPDIMVIEPNLQRFLKALEIRDWSKDILNPQVHWVVGQNAEECYTAFGALTYEPRTAFILEAHQFVRHPVLSQMYSGYFERCWEQFAAAADQASMLFGYPEDSLLGVKNTIENIEMIETSPGICELKDKFKGVPAVVVATGPSLIESIPALKKLQDRALILAADGSLSILLDHGITPHFVLSLERDQFSAPFFEKASKKHGPLKSELLAFPLVPKEVLAAYDGPKWVVYRNYGWYSYLEAQNPKGVLPSWSSVTHFACKVAEYLGCSSAFLVGQDLAFDPDKLSSHAEGVAYAEWNETKTEDQLRKEIRERGDGDLMWVPGNLKERVPTSTIYNQFGRQFSMLQTQLSIKITNCTQGGARIPLLDWERLEDCSQTWTPRPNLFSTIKESRKVSDKKINMGEHLGYLGELNQKFRHLFDTFTSIMENSQLAREKKLEIVQSVRKSLVETMDDVRFVRWIIQNAGSRLLVLENQINKIYWDDLTTLDKQTTLLRDWISHILFVGERLHHTMKTELTRVDEEKKFERQSLVH